MTPRSGQLFTRKTQAIFYNYKPKPVQRMLDFDYLCWRDTPSVAAIVQPSAGTVAFQKVFFGEEEIAIPMYAAVRKAAEKHPLADVFINFASFRSAFASSMEALRQPTIRVVAIIAEGVPEKDTKALVAYARANNKVVIGPSTVGGIQAGAFKIGDTGGTIENILACKLYRPGSVGFVSKSGGMSNEAYNILSRTTDGLYEGVAIGGDVYPGSTLSEHAQRYEHIPEIKLIVVLGEIGGLDEYELCEAMRQGRVTKPVVAWVAGTCAALFRREVQFGHAGAKSGSEQESAQAKNSALREAGAVVPQSFEGLAACVEETFNSLVNQGFIIVASREAGEGASRELLPRKIPEELRAAQKAGKVRVPTNVVCTISDDRGEEPTYCGIKMSEIVEKNFSIGQVVCLLWFKRQLPSYCVRFIEMCVVICADHGPCVSGAHNSIVTSRAGKDLGSCLAAGLLTIGPRFGGAVDDAARLFREACNKDLVPEAFVEEMKAKGLKIPGIGHRIKSKDNKDKRVELLLAYAKEHFPSTKTVDFALSVEQYTLTKNSHLILNVDGCIGALFVDLLYSSSMFSFEEIDDILRIGYLNGLFMLARSIGFIGHALDQKRMNQPLYRHPWDEVLYCNE